MDNKDPLTYAIIGAAMEVHRELGSGFLEQVYQEALAIEFQNREIPFAREEELLVCYKGQPLNSRYRTDFICFNSIVVEIKAIRELSKADEAQIIHYLKATEKKLGLLLNFGTTSLQYCRFVK